MLKPPQPIAELSVMKYSTKLFFQTTYTLHGVDFFRNSSTVNDLPRIGILCDVFVRNRQHNNPIIAL